MRTPRKLLHRTSEYLNELKSKKELEAEMERMVRERGFSDPEETPWEFCLWGGDATLACSDPSACGCDTLRPDKVKVLA